MHSFVTSAPLPHQAGNASARKSETDERRVMDNDTQSTFANVLETFPQPPETAETITTVAAAQQPVAVEEAAKEVDNLRSDGFGGSLRSNASEPDGREVKTLAPHVALIDGGSPSKAASAEVRGVPEIKAQPAMPASDQTFARAIMTEQTHAKAVDVDLAAVSKHSAVRQFETSVAAKRSDLAARNLQTEQHHTISSKTAFFDRKSVSSELNIHGNGTTERQTGQHVATASLTAQTRNTPSLSKSEFATAPIPQQIAPHSVPATDGTRGSIAAIPFESGKDTVTPPLGLLRQPPKQPNKQHAIESNTASPPTVTRTKPYGSVPMPATQAVVSPQDAATISKVQMAEGDPLQISRSDALVAPTANQLQQLHHRIEAPMHVARQMADALQSMPNRPVEIALNPEELGRVRLAMSASDAGLTVTILTERPETMDLMRRHIASLETAFQEIGYDNVNFSFAGGSDPQNDTDTAEDTTPRPMPDPEDLAQDDMVSLTLGPVSGLDLRL